MAEVKDVLAYILQRYPSSGDLSNARVTKMVFLSDWRHVLVNGTQITPIRWYFDNFGPFVWDVVDVARDHPDLFRVDTTENSFGSSKTVLSCVAPSYQPRLSASEKAAIRHVMDVTQPLPWGEFINLVYSTFPIVASDRYSYLDLAELAEEYRHSPLYGDTSVAAEDEDDDLPF